MKSKALAYFQLGMVDSINSRYATTLFNDGDKWYTDFDIVIRKYFYYRILNREYCDSEIPDNLTNETDEIKTIKPMCIRVKNLTPDGKFIITSEGDVLFRGDKPDERLIKLSKRIITYRGLTIAIPGDIFIRLHLSDYLKHNEISIVDICYMCYKDLEKYLFSQKSVKLKKINSIENFYGSIMNGLLNYENPEWYDQSYSDMYRRGYLFADAINEI